MRDKKSLELSKLFQNGCVLQQGEGTRIWGFGEPGMKVTISIQGKQICTEINEEGRFDLKLPRLLPGGPWDLKAEGENQEAVISQVFVGDVFVCAGQSNMELPMRRVAVRYPEEFEQGGCEGVHIYKVIESPEFQQTLQEHREAAWHTCGREYLEEASAMSYFLGKYLYGKRKVPIGILNLSLGGTPAEAWMSRQGLKAYPDLLETARKYEDAELRAQIVENYEKKIQDWHKRLEKQESAAPVGQQGRMKLPGWLKEQGLSDFCGVLWLFKTFEAPKGAEEENGLLRLGTLADSDRVFINGVLVGETAYRYPPRRYQVPKGVLKTGENHIAIRLVCQEGDGRVTPEKDHDLVLEHGEKILLEGQWQYEIKATAEPAPVQEFLNRKPACLFQGMVAPCIPYSVKGVVWYQGESNDRQPEQYERLLKSLILDWRAHWNQERLPFVVVQLPNCGIDIAPGEAWPLIRRAQSRAAGLPDVAVTVNLDIGEDFDLHPLNKKEAARRAGLALEHLVYAENVVYQGPKVKEVCWEKERGRLVLEFTTGDQGDLKVLEGEIPAGFEVETEDGGFEKTAAKIERNKVFLDCGERKGIRRVRYAWSCTPGRQLLCNQAGLLAEPFEVEVSEETERNRHEKII